MIKIDGAQGEGGGQILRSSLALAMCTGQAVQINNIRAKRKKPGLLRQHLTAVRAATEICAARCEGADLGSRELRFIPGDITAGEYTFAIGTAGSTSLVLQTILPALLIATQSSKLTLEGGTHNPFAPPFEFIQQAFIPLLERMGAQVTVELERPGFFPAGGGRFTVAIKPAVKQQLQALSLNSRGAVIEQRAIAVRAGLPGHVTERELATVKALTGWDDSHLEQREFNYRYGPGNCLHLLMRSESVCEVFTGFGQRGVSAEQVAKRCVREWRRYLASEAAVAEHLADQLLLPLALAGGGEFTSLTPTRHTLTNAQVIERFLPVRVSHQSIGPDCCRFEVKTN